MMSMFRVAAGSAFRGRVAMISIANSGPLRNFSGRSERSDLVEALDNEFKITQLVSAMPAVPGDFPFKFKDLRYRGPEMMKKFGEEKISVEVREFERIRESSSSNSKSSDDTVDLKVNISKGDGKLMHFVVTCSAADEIEIQRLSVMIERNHPETDDVIICSQLYIRPDCEMQFALREFLEKRAIQKSILGFLREYLVLKSKMPYYSWYKYPSTRKFNQENAETTLTKLKEVVQAW